MGKGWADIHIGKGVFGRFGFDDRRISQIHRQVKNKATGTPLGCIVYIPFKMQYPFLWMDCILWDDYIYIYVGLSALLVSTYRAMREASHSGTSDGLAPRFFFVYGWLNFLKARGAT